jgi:hypothetical protein
MVVEMNQTKGTAQYRKRYEGYPIADRDILHVFPCAPAPHHVAEARRALRRKQRTVEASAS